MISKRAALAATVVLLAVACVNRGGSSSSGTSVAPSTSSGTSATTPTAPVTATTPTPPPAPVTTASAFVTVDRANARFLLGGKPFYFAATNAYYLAQEHAYGSSVTTDALDAAQAVGIRVIRTIAYDDGWAISKTNPQDPAIIQLSPGVYNATGLAALDFVVAEAAKRDMKLVLVLVNNWDDFGGMDQYVAWAGASGHDAFFTDARVKQLYQSYVRDIVTRYKDEPAILGWELANEARCASDPWALGGVLASWYAEMARFVKSIDPNHLVGTGEEGNDVSSSGYSTYTNGSWLDGMVGSSFQANIAIPEIDWATVHVYPDSAGMTDPQGDGAKWIADHARLARAQGKPLMVGEYGLSTSPHSIYASWLDTVLAEDVAGAALWQLVPASRWAQVSEPTDVVSPADANDVAALAAHAAAMNAK